MRRPARSASLIAAGFLAALPVASIAGVLNVPIDHTVKLQLRGPAASVVVGNPAVADVQVIDSRTVFVAGRGFGTTDVTVIDSLGRTIYSSDIEVAAPKKGQVALFRGGQRSDMICNPSCGVVTAAGTTAAAAAPPAVGAAATAANSAAGLPGQVMPGPMLGALTAAAAPR